MDRSVKNPNPVRTGHLLAAASADGTVRLWDAGVLPWFRRTQWRGSQSWRYTLCVLGAMVQAATTATTPTPLPKPGRVVEQVLTLAASPRLTHLLAVNEFFAGLAGHAHRHPECALTQWWPERRATTFCGGIARPDAAGEWLEPGRHETGWHSPGRRVAFWLARDWFAQCLHRWS